MLQDHVWIFRFVLFRPTPLRGNDAQFQKCAKLEMDFSYMLHGFFSVYRMAVIIGSRESKWAAFNKTNETLNNRWGSILMKLDV